MTEYKMVIVMRKDLGMRKGKMIAQGAHAAVDAIMSAPRDCPHANGWLWGGRAKVCVYVESADALVSVYEHAKRATRNHHLVIDAGKTEFHGEHTMTCCAIGPGPADEIDKITGDLPLL